MKRWLSASLAIVSFVSVLSVSVLTIISLHAATRLASASPYSVAPPQVKSADFTTYESIFSLKGITLSTSPKQSTDRVSFTPVSTHDPQVIKTANELAAEWQKQ